MEKINIWLKNNIQSILLVFLYLQPIIDLLTSLCINFLHINLTFGIIVRILFLMFLLYCFIILEKLKDKKIISYLSILLLYFMVYTISIFVYKDSSVLSYEISNTMRTFYFPIILVLIMNINKNKNLKIETSHYLKVIMIYISFIIIPTILGLNFNGYKEGKVGNIGWFNSTNEISAIISLILPIIGYLLLIKKNKWYQVIISALILFVIFNLGSKITILSLLITVFFYSFIYVKRLIKEKSYKKIGILLSIFIVLTSSILLYLPKTNFYKNIEIHLNFLGVNNINEVFTNYKLFDHFIFSSRLSFLNQTSINYQESSLFEKTVGIGYIEKYATDDVNLKMIEIDPFDILFRHGILGFILYFLPFVYYIYFGIKKYFYKYDFSNFPYFISLLISILLMSLSGHVLTSPAVSFYLALIILYLNNIKQEVQ